MGSEMCIRDRFIASMKRGDKAVVKLMLDAIDRKEIPLVELKDRLDRARIEATENGNLHLLPIFRGLLLGKEISMQVDEDSFIISTCHLQINWLE